MYRILIAEDDADIAKLESDYLRAADFEVEVIDNGNDVLSRISAQAYDLIILDIMLPGVDGYELCMKIRGFSDVPIILVTAKAEAGDIVKGLGLGSDDYVTKPFDPAVLVARVQASIERYRRHKNIGEEIRLGDLEIIPQKHQVFYRQEEVRLTIKEFELLYFLASHPGVVFSKEDLFEEIWGLDSLSEESTVTVHINRLRSKLNDGIFETVWGRGYKIVGP